MSHKKINLLKLHLREKMPKLSKLTAAVSCIEQLGAFLEKELLRHFESDPSGRGFLGCRYEDVEDFFGSRWVLGFILDHFLKKTNRHDRKVLRQYANQGELPRIFFAIDPCVRLEDFGKKKQDCMRLFWNSCSEVAQFLAEFGHENLSVQNIEWLVSGVKSPHDWIYKRIIQIVECFGLRKVNDVASQFILGRKLRIDDLYCEISPELQVFYGMEVFKKEDCDLSECRTHMALEAVYSYFWPKMAIKKKSVSRLCNPNSRFSFVMSEFLGPEASKMKLLLM